MPIPNINNDFLELKHLISDKQNLEYYLQTLSLNSLEKLSKELQKSLDEILLCFSSKEFNLIMQKTDLPLLMKTVIRTSKRERVGSLTKGFLSVAIGTLSTLIGAISVLPLLIVSGSLVIGFSFLRGILEQHNLNKTNNKIFFEANLDNLAILSLQELNRRKYLSVTQKVATLLPDNINTLTSSPQHNLEHLVNNLEKYTQKTIDHSVEYGVRLKDKIQQLKNSIVQTNLNFSNEQKLTVCLRKQSDKQKTEHNALTFTKWRQLNTNSLFKRVLDEAGVKLTETFIVMGFTLTVIKTTGVTGIAALLTGPIGISVIAGAALLTGLAIGGITLYNLYREEKRKYELNFILKRALRGENKISHKLNSIQNQLQGIEEDIKYTQAPPTLQPVHKNDINSLQATLAEINQKVDKLCITTQPIAPPLSASSNSFLANHNNFIYPSLIQTEKRSFDGHTNGPQDENVINEKTQDRISYIYTY